MRTADAQGRAVNVEDFDGFYRREFGGLVVLATAVLGRRAGAEDVVQEAMLDAYRRWDRIGAYDAPRAWLRKVVVQRGIKVAKKRSNERVAQLRARAGEPEVSGAAPEELDPALRAALIALPDRQRATLALHYLADSSLREIGEALGISEGTVKTHLARGRAQMADALRQPGSDTPASNDNGG